jgi:hypothetical protein
MSHEQGTNDTYIVPCGSACDDDEHSFALAVMCPVASVALLVALTTVQAASFTYCAWMSRYLERVRVLG